MKVKGTLEGKKLTRAASNKINRRYVTKLQEFKEKTNEELVKLRETKMSSTDKFALEMAIQVKMKQSFAEAQEKNKKNGETVESDSIEAE